MPGPLSQKGQTLHRVGVRRFMAAVLGPCCQRRRRARLGSSRARHRQPVLRWVNYGLWWIHSGNLVLKMQSIWGTGSFKKVASGCFRRQQVSSCLLDVVGREVFHAQIGANWSDTPVGGCRCRSACIEEAVALLWLSSSLRYDWNLHSL